MTFSHFKIEDNSFPPSESHVGNFAGFRYSLIMLNDGTVRSVAECRGNKETANAAPIASVNSRASRSAREEGDSGGHQIATEAIQQKKRALIPPVTLFYVSDEIEFGNEGESHLCLEMDLSPLQIMGTTVSNLYQDKSVEICRLFTSRFPYHLSLKQKHRLALRCGCQRSIHFHKC